MKVSIVVPTIGRKTLKLTLDSLFSQTYQDFEVIVTDDSNGSAYSIIEEYKEYIDDGRLIYVLNDNYPKGPTGNKSNGLDYITGDYFLILDDDDELFPEALEELVMLAIKYKYEIIISNCIDPCSGELTGKHYGKSEEISYFDFLCRYEGKYLMFVKTDLLLEDRFDGNCWGCECILWWKLFKRSKKSYYYHRPLEIYNRFREDSVTVGVVKCENIYPRFLAYRKILLLYSDELGFFCYKKFFRYYIMFLVMASITDNKRDMFSFLGKAFSINKKYALILCLLIFFFYLTPSIVVRKFFSHFGHPKSWLRRNIKKLFDN